MKLRLESYEFRKLMEKIGLHHYYENELGYERTVDETSSVLTLHKLGDEFEHTVVIYFYEGKKYKIDETVINRKGQKHIDSVTYTEMHVNNLKLESIQEHNGVKTKKLIFDNKILIHYLNNELTQLGFKKTIF